MQLWGQLVIASQLAGAQQPRQQVHSWRQALPAGRPGPRLAGAAGLAGAVALPAAALLTDGQQLLSRRGR